MPAGVHPAERTAPVLAQSDTAPAAEQSPEQAPAQTDASEEKPAEPPLTIESWLIDTPDEIVATLSNGLQVAIKENHTNPVVAVRLYVATGSVHEDQHLGAGLSHIFEHLLHGGATPARTVWPARPQPDRRDSLPWLAETGR